MQRAGWVLGVFAVHALYFPLTYGQQGGVAIRVSLDGAVPLWPIWVVPYLGTWVFWIAGSAWLAWHADEPLFRAALVGLFTAAIIGVACFTFYPTYVIRPALTGSGWAVDLLRLVYAIDGMYNAFPSGHVYITTVLALYLARGYPRWSAAWAAVTLIIAASTVLTGQHYVLDPVGGLALGIFAYFTGLWVTGQWPVWPGLRRSAG